MMALNLIDINEDLMVSLISMVLTFWEQYLYVSNQKSMKISIYTF